MPVDWLYLHALGRARARLAAEGAVLGEAEGDAGVRLDNQSSSRGAAALTAQRERLDSLEKQVEAGHINESDYLNQVNELRDNYNAIIVHQRP